MRKTGLSICLLLLLTLFCRADKPVPVIQAFLKKFDRISEMGFVPTLRSGSTGIGYTLETMLQIEENNSPLGDFRGMELKAYRDEDLSTGNKKMNLFLKEPVWTDGMRSAERVWKYGYQDQNGRTALYSTVQIKENSHAFGLRVDKVAKRVLIQFQGKDVGYWEFDTLESRLKEKLSEAVFVAARSRGIGKSEEFHYYGVQWCRNPSIDAFIELLLTGDVVLELRMHIKENGSARNHGSAFRVRQNRIPKLYESVDQLRPK